jgi:hypothetical protein
VALVVEAEDVVGLAHVQVDGAFVDRGVRALRLDEAEHRARLGLDDAYDSGLVERSEKRAAG